MRIYAIYAGETDATLNHFCFHANAVEMRLLLLLLLFGPKTRVCVCVFFDSFYFSPQGCCTINFIGFTSLYFPTYLFQSREKKPTNERTNIYVGYSRTNQNYLHMESTKRIGPQKWSAFQIWTQTHMIYTFPEREKENNIKECSTHQQ